MRHDFELRLRLVDGQGAAQLAANRNIAKRRRSEVRKMRAKQSKDTNPSDKPSDVNPGGYFVCMFAFH